MFMGSTDNLVTFDNLARNHPPCIWGALILAYYTTIVDRIIPMFMGSTMNNALDELATENHPHVYGEHH